jgi:hypothetical protein
MKITYKTDAVSGTMETESLQAALDTLDAQESISDCLSDCLSDGAWAWVEDMDGNRLYLGRENMG